MVIIVVLALFLSGCTIFQQGVSRCVVGPASLNINVGVGPSNGMLLIELKEGGEYHAVAPGEPNPCPRVSVPSP